MLLVVLKHFTKWPFEILLNWLWPPLGVKSLTHAKIDLLAESWTTRKKKRVVLGVARYPRYDLFLHICGTSRFGGCIGWNIFKFKNAPTRILIQNKSQMFRAKIRTKGKASKVLWVYLVARHLVSKINLFVTIIKQHQTKRLWEAIQSSPLLTFAFQFCKEM